jgi:hypothetical protein
MGLGGTPKDGLHSGRLIANYTVNTDRGVAIGMLDVLHEPSRGGYGQIFVQHLVVTGSA